MQIPSKFSLPSPTVNSAHLGELGANGILSHFKPIFLPFQNSLFDIFWAPHPFSKSPPFSYFLTGKIDRNVCKFLESSQCFFGIKMPFRWRNSLGKWKGEINHFVILLAIIMREFNGPPREKWASLEIRDKAK